MAFAVEVSEWLRADGHENFLDRAPVDGVQVGEDWRERLYGELRQVDAIVCLVSRGFLTSFWCSAEVGIADALGCRILQLRLDDVVHPLLHRLQYADFAADPHRAREQLLRAVRGLDLGREKWCEGQNPFPGLKAFTAELSGLFFGRADETRELSSRLRAATTSRLLAVVGPSGCGKSSLVRAGLLPVLAQESDWLPLVPLTPGDDPVAALARSITATARRLGMHWSVAGVREELERDGVTRLADELVVAGAGPDAQVLVVIDQAEELFTRAVDAHAFAELVAPVRVVATLRSEFLDQLNAAAGTQVDTFLLAPLSRDMLRVVITEPARIAGLRVEPDLVARLVADTGRGEALPLLAFVLHQLAEGLSRGGEMSLARYHELGGVRGALSRHADSALVAATGNGRLTETEIVAGLVALATVNERVEPTRRRVAADVLAVDVSEFVLRRLLVVTSDDDGGRWVEVAHEALLTGWPPLRDAISDRSAALVAARSVEKAADEWRENESDDFLWSGERLTTTLKTLRPDHAAGAVVDVSPAAQSFLDAGVRRNRRGRSRRIALIAVVALLLTSALTAAGLAWQQQRYTAEQRAIAQARQLVPRAEQLREVSPVQALRLGLAAERLHSDSETRDSLVNTLLGSGYRSTLTGHSAAVAKVVFSDDGRWLATAGTDKTVVLWKVDASGGVTRARTLTGHGGPVLSLAFHPDGTLLASGAKDGQVLLWDTADAVPPVHLPANADMREAPSVVFSPDGTTLATAGSSGSVLFWDVRQRTAPRLLAPAITEHRERVVAIEWRRNGGLLVTGSEDNTARLWDVHDLANVRAVGAPLTAHIEDVNAVPLSPDGRLLATASADHLVLLWDVSDPAAPRRLGEPLVGHANWVNTGAFSGDGSLLATGGADKTVIVWDVRDPGRPRRQAVLSGHEHGVNTVAFRQNLLATAGRDQKVMLWEAAETAVTQQFTAHTSYVNAMAATPDGRTLATAGADRTVLLWDTSALDRVQRAGDPLRTPQGAAAAVAFRGDGRLLAAGAGRDVVLWDTSDLARARQITPPLTGHRGTVRAVEFRPDRRVLASGSSDGQLMLWDTGEQSGPRALGEPVAAHESPLWTLAFNQAGTVLVTGAGDGKIALWDVRDPAAPRRIGEPLSGHTNRVNSLAFSPDDRLMASGGEDKTVQLWDLTDPSNPRGRGTIAGHGSPIKSVAFDQDGRVLATGAADNETRLWDVTGPVTQLGPPLDGHTNWVNAIEFPARGRAIVTGSADGTIRVRDLTGFYDVLNHPVARACQRAGRGLDPQEWARSVDLRFEQSCP
ncbi:hypothetical protein BBK82_43410 [Lentzea guizhouensis]|uniref:Uncharacterized protein n=2 Tax=Lentzea guizhouensis TaxID=1586287 RepID=A0A1B2HVK7_9PSEU|nr:hypothetical protein BBK82_43410 [Lentzea guizhouensis]